MCHVRIKHTEEWNLTISYKTTVRSSQTKMSNYSLDSFLQQIHWVVWNHPTDVWTYILVCIFIFQKWHGGGNERKMNTSGLNNLVCQINNKNSWRKLYHWHKITLARAVAADTGSLMPRTVHANELSKTAGTIPMAGEAPISNHLYQVIHAIPV
jgi:hypothetical protein